MVKCESKRNSGSEGTATMRSTTSAGSSMKDAERVGLDVKF